MESFEDHTAQKESLFKQLTVAFLRRMLRLSIALIIVSIGFLATDTPIFDSVTSVMAWVLISMFLCISTSLLSKHE